MKNTALVKNWFISNNQDGFTSPECLKFYLNGDIYHDTGKRFADGDKITTGSIKNITECPTHKVVSTSSTDYLVYPEDVDPDYERKYPGAYERLAMRREEG